MSHTADSNLAEQLSALMDGELPEQQARFLRRRLEHDADLRAAWSRLHLASSCLKGHAVQPLALDCARVRADANLPGRRGWMRWAAVASVAALAVALAPRFVSAPDTDAASTARVASVASSSVASDSVAPAAVPAAPSPASADLVALRPAADGPAAIVPASASEPSPASLLASNTAPADSSPLSVNGQSPADFALVDTGEKAWPRSSLEAVGSDPQLEAYLVRHNQMLAEGGLGGFVPYVDVVARDPARSAADAAPAATEPATK